MGIVTETAQFICEAYQTGVRFDQTLTLGRQSLRVEAERIKQCVPGYAGDLDRLCAPGAYAEALLTEVLGAQHVAAVDMTDFEGADIQHDMNTPVPAELEQQYDVVIDGGTLEHVFNFPVAISNCMNMLKIGGTLFIFTNANNFMGHGFYQFSPELFYRVLSPAYGFTIERMIAIEYKTIATELGAYKQRYQVYDPAALGSRLTLVNSRPLALLIQARKTAHQPNLFASYPLQSDYVTRWQQARHPQRPGQRARKRLRPPVKTTVRAVYRLLPHQVQSSLIVRYRNWKRHSLHNTAFFRPLP